MSKNIKLLPPIELERSIQARPSQVFRALTSQNELRKWWAPHVAMSRNKVSQKKDQYAYMKLISSKEKEKSLVRYIWRPEHWPVHAPTSTITLSISDMGTSRQSGGDGLLLELSHEGWPNEEERNEQEQIWGLALESLQSLLENKKPLAWWKGRDEIPSWQQVKLQELKQILDSLKKKKDRNRKNKNFHKLWQICTALDEHGKWYWNEEEQSFQFKCQNQKILNVNGEKIFLFWKQVDFLSPFYLKDVKERLSVEQDFIFSPEEEETNISIDSLQTELWLAWCLDLLREIKRKAKKPR